MSNRCGYCNKEITNVKIKNKVNNSYIDVCSMQCDKKFKKNIIFKEKKTEFRVTLVLQIIILIGGILLVTEEIINSIIITLGALTSTAILIKNNKKLTVKNIREVGLKAIIREKNVMNVMMLALMLVSVIVIALGFNII